MRLPDPAGGSGPLAILGNLFAQMDGGGFPVLPEADVQELDADGKGHGKIDVPLGHVDAEPLCHEGETDQEEKCQGEHLDGRVVVHEAPDGPGGEQHHPYGQDDGDDHDGQVRHETHGRNDRIEGKHDVQDGDLRQDGKKPALLDSRGIRGRDNLQAAVYLMRGFSQEEKASGDEDQVPPGKVLPEDGKQRFHQAHDPDNAEEKRQPGQHRQAQPQPSRPVSLRSGEPAHENGDEDDVIDPEDHLEGHQRSQRNPRFGAVHPCQHVRFPIPEGPAHGAAKATVLVFPVPAQGGILVQDAS